MDKHAKRAGKLKPKYVPVPEEIGKLPPHKKPKAWALAVEWTQTRTMRRECKFASRAARDEARRRIERDFREKAAKEAARKPRKWDNWYNRGPFADFDDLEVTKINAGPTYTESYLDDCGPNMSGSP